MFTFVLFESFSRRSLKGQLYSWVHIFSYWFHMGIELTIHIPCFTNWATQDYAFCNKSIFLVYTLQGCGHGCALGHSTPLLQCHSILCQYNINRQAIPSVEQGPLKSLSLARRPAGRGDWLHLTQWAAAHRSGLGEHRHTGLTGTISPTQSKDRDRKEGIRHVTNSYTYITLCFFF